MAYCHIPVYQGNGLDQLPEENTILPPPSYETNDHELLTSSRPDGYTLLLLLCNKRL